MAIPTESIGISPRTTLVTLPSFTVESRLSSDLICPAPYRHSQTQAMHIGLGQLVFGIVAIID